MKNKLSENMASNAIKVLKNLDIIFEIEIGNMVKEKVMEKGGKGQINVSQQSSDIINTIVKERKNLVDKLSKVTGYERFQPLNKFEKKLMLILQWQSTILNGEEIQHRNLHKYTEHNQTLKEIIDKIIDIEIGYVGEIIQ
jgi:hypothetical protein